ncbi:MAG TPA: hypothetical protein PKD28_03930 [Candidatus Saccharibacteria bacterium]|nr:hypothetical protein [Candidatus Saccharibacteria bacterium]
MYSFGPIPRLKRSGRIIGTHQKINRVARRQLAPYLVTKLAFPSISEILHFEGSRGPDGIKMKSPGQDEPRHFVDPATVSAKSSLVIDVRDHGVNLTEALRSGNMERAAFEASWLAHAVTDGLTPAHHDPLDDQIKHMKATGHRKDKFTSRIVMTGHGSKKQFIKNNWQYWGTKGAMTSHALFEGGVATTVQSKTFRNVDLNPGDIEQLKKRGFQAMYIDMIKEVDSLKMYEQLKEDGWTHDLAVQTVKQLLPIIFRAVTLAWYEAYLNALSDKPKGKRAR